MGVINTSYTFNATDLVTSGRLNNLIDDTVFTTDAYDGTTITVGSGKLKVATGGITANEIAVDAVTTVKILDGSVTANKLGAGAAVPSGAVMPFAMNSVPSGWLAANAAAVSRTTYAALYAAIGTVYGVGDGSTTFNLPDLRGYFVRGLDNSRNIDPGRAIGTNQADELKSHTHSMYNHPGTDNGSSTGAARFYEYLGSGAVEIQATGGTETRPKNIAMLYCIKI